MERQAATTKRERAEALSFRLICDASIYVYEKMGSQDEGDGIFACGNQLFASRALDAAEVKRRCLSRHEVLAARQINRQLPRQAVGLFEHLARCIMSAGECWGSYAILPTPRPAKLQEPAWRLPAFRTELSSTRTVAAVNIVPFDLLVQTADVLSYLHTQTADPFSFEDSRVAAQWLALVGTSIFAFDKLYKRRP